MLGEPVLKEPVLGEPVSYRRAGRTYDTRSFFFCFVNSFFISCQNIFLFYIIGLERRVSHSFSYKFLV